MTNLFECLENFEFEEELLSINNVLTMIQVKTFNKVFFSKFFCMKIYVKNKSYTSIIFRWESVGSFFCVQNGIRDL